MARPKVEDPEARGRILVAAEALFAERGFAGTPTRDIAARAGVNAAMIHYYFGNKETLYREVLENGVGSARALIEEAAAGEATLEGRLTRFVEAYATFVFTHPNLARLLHRELLAGGKTLMELRKNYPVNNYAVLYGTLAESARRGELRIKDVDLAPISLLGMIVVFQFMQPVILAALGKKKYDEAFIKRLSAHTVDLFLHGALRPPAEDAAAAKATAAPRRKR